ncbi:DUF2530 domain-containing protein [Nonomuraea roseoviolacea subsp. roseoviolacea]|uniref:O-antigen/teichoic acid export membrane protein n=1 Tax=Nonomuraea roseoviolacea subsp. carminata TaxID=160689 RepID=A0ABT1K2Y6_9ACTN|nr:DUF2530 domain-containing protein [Nonomuraea roseoviolacea]MCP2348027.1 O-antigen/teichoic acid export membrane protein [Nonomuraea roseoviolacea subsp. carminata]
MKQEWHPDPEPIETNDTATVAVGTGLWALALVVLLVLRPDPAHMWWVWTCVAGVVLGLMGLWYVHRRASRG